MTLAIGVDVGGTKVAAGVVDEDGRIIAKLKRSTPAASPERTEQAIADAVTELLAHHRVEAIGLGRGQLEAAGRPVERRVDPGLHRAAPLPLRCDARLVSQAVINIVKNSAVAMTIGFTELTFQTQEIEAKTFRGFEAATAVTILYIALAFAIVVIMHGVERFARLDLKRG